jgi:hypothetical protein
LDEQDERVDGVAEAVEDEEFPVVGREADFIFLFVRKCVIVEENSHTYSIIDKMHFSIQYGIGMFELQNIAFVQTNRLILILDILRL